MRESGEKTLERMRFQFPEDWLYSDQLNGEWNAFQEILRRKNDSIQGQLGASALNCFEFLSLTQGFHIAGLQLKITGEDKVVDNKIGEIITEREQTRPVQGNIRAEIAMATIASFEAKLNKVQDKYELVCRAKEALDLDLVRRTRLEPVFEELRDLKAVWTALSGVWSQIGALKETPWATAVPRKLRQ